MDGSLSETTSILPDPCTSYKLQIRSVTWPRKLEPWSCFTSELLFKASSQPVGGNQDPNRQQTESC